MKLIAVDLDGTLLNHSKEVLESSRQAIAAAAAAGVQVVVASGRSFPEAQRFVAGTACSEHVICAGGAAVISFLYACSDELHQSFVAGRDGKFADVGVDAIGFLTVSILILAVWYLVLLWKHRHSPDISPHAK